MSECVSSLAFVFFGPEYEPPVRRRCSDRQSPPGRSIGPNALCRQHRLGRSASAVDRPDFRTKSFTDTSSSPREAAGSGADGTSAP